MNVTAREEKENGERGRKWNPGTRGKARALDEQENEDFSFERSKGSNNVVKLVSYVNTVQR